MTLAPLTVSGCLPAGNPAQLPGITPTDAGAFPITATTKVKGDNECGTLNGLFFGIGQGIRRTGATAWLMRSCPCLAEKSLSTCTTRSPSAGNLSRKCGSQTASPQRLAGRWSNGRTEAQATTSARGAGALKNLPRKTSPTFPITARGGYSTAGTLSRAGRASSRRTNSGQARFRAGRSPASSLFETGRGFGPGLFSRGNMMKGRSEPENAAFVVITQTAALWIGANHEYGAAE